MKRSEAARYARWSAALAFFLAVVTAGVYVQHGWVAHRQRRDAPPAPPGNVERQSNGLTFSKVEGNRKIFTVEASKSTEFRDQDASLLEEVKVTIFGQQGDRHDVIRTHSCQYGKTSGSISCSGNVQIDLQNAADAELTRQHPGTDPVRMAHVQTRAVTFDEATGTARTDQGVTFAFPEGSGEAIGVEYNSRQGTMHLLRDVKMNLVQSNGPKGGSGQPVHITGSRLDFDRTSRLLHLLGPTHSETQTEKLDAGELTLNLNEDLRAQKLFATEGPHRQRPHAVSSGPSGGMAINANVLTALFDPDGWVKKLDASGNVDGSRKTDAENDVFTAGSASVDMWPEIGQPKQVNLDGNSVITATLRDGQERVLKTDQGRMDFTHGSEEHPSQPKRAETLTAGDVQWTDAPQADKPTVTQTHLRADKLVLDFANGVATQVAATGNVQAERALPGGPVQTTSAKRGVAQLAANGGWSQISMDDGVRFKEGDRSGQADHAVSIRDTQTTTLTGRAMVRDVSTETHAATIIFMQATGDIRASGGVHSTSFPNKGGDPRLANSPATITSERMQANSDTGRALYSGKARLWQGDSVLESDSIELLQKTKELKALGNVRAVFLQAPDQTAAHPATTSESDKPGTKSAGPNQSAKKPELWHIASKNLNYLDLENRAHLEGNVVVQSETQRMRSPLLDLYFTRSKPAADAEKSSPANASGPQQISRAVGTGGCIVEEQARKATAERAEYTASDGKFVMSGGNPTLYDSSQGTTTGRQLTFFLADDTIIVDSENGSRTLTKHRVEK
jgi:lipopolysaccharide export system protein LptA